METLLKSLALKFGQPSAAVEKRVRSASMAQLDRLSERMLTAASMRELFADARIAFTAGAQPQAGVEAYLDCD